MYKLIINYKTYKESFDEKAIEITKIADELHDYANKNDVEIVVCPDLLDLKEIAKLGVKTYSQHVDSCSFGAHTGSIIPEELQNIGVRGVLISHSEDFDEFTSIEEKVKISKNIGLETCVCVRDLDIIEKVRELNPDYIALEPPELIGGDVSVTTKPELVKKGVNLTEPVNLLVGAGVKNSADVREAVKLGAKGILVASGVVKSDNIKDAIIDLIDGFKKEK